MLVGAGVGIPLGAFAAARGGMVDGFVMRMTDLAFAFPALLTAVIITAIFGPGAVNAMIAIGIFNVPVFARVTRGASLGLWKREYVQAARCAGRGDISIDRKRVAIGRRNRTCETNALCVCSER